MPIPTLATFKTQTTYKSKNLVTAATDALFVKRGANMMLVDIALSNWEQHQAAAAAEERMVLLYQLVKECDRWLAKKQPKPGQPAKNSKRFAKRQQAIRQLAADAKAEMLLVAPAVARQLDRFAATKAAGGKVGSMQVAPTVLPTRVMAGGYAREREHYEKIGKAAHPASGSKAHDVFSRYDASDPGHAPVRNPVPAVVATVTRAGAFDQLTLADFETLMQGLGAKANGQVIYLNKVRRLKYLAVPNDLDGLLYDINDQPIDFANGVNDRIGSRAVLRYSPVPYAMDRYGNLFLSARLPKEGEVSQYNHSSFNAGREVICAGTIHVGGAKPGRLQFIDNGSGHYQPTADDLFRCVGVLQDQGVDVDHACVRVFDGRADKLYTAATFLRTQGRGQPDWDLNTAPCTFLY